MRLHSSDDLLVALTKKIDRNILVVFQVNQFGTIAVK